MRKTKLFFAFFTREDDSFLTNAAEAVWYVNKSRPNNLKYRLKFWGDIVKRSQTSRSSQNNYPSLPIPGKIRM